MSIGSTVFLFAVCAALFQFGATLLFRRFLRRSSAVGFTAGNWPSASVLVSLRGADPDLEQSLVRLMSQDYPNYDLRIVVDSKSDPAWRAVDAARRRTGFQYLHLEELLAPLPTCGLKNSALLQLVRGLPRHQEVVVLADADLSAHSTWLRSLVAPLADKRVGASSGNRWFWPSRASWGGVVRYLWNAAAVVPMTLLGMPWGGSLAFRRRFLEDGSVLGKWSRAIVDDSPIKLELDRLGLRIAFVPELMMVNREACSLPFAAQFIRRQLTWTRIYHPGWSFVFGHAIVSTPIMLAVPLLAGIAAVRGNSSLAAWTAAAVGFYFAALLLMLATLESSVRSVVRQRGDQVANLGWRFWLQCVFALPLTQFVHAGAATVATFAKQITWRGVRYQIADAWNVRRLDHHPINLRTAAADESV